jgi:hypothetical protein
MVTSEAVLERMEKKEEDKHRLGIRAGMPSIFSS